MKKICGLPVACVIPTRVCKPTLKIQSQIAASGYLTPVSKGGDVILLGQKMALTPVEQERLDVLQAKMDEFWAQGSERSSRTNYNFATIPVHAPGRQVSTPVQPRLPLRLDEAGVPPQFLPPTLAPALTSERVIQTKGDIAGPARASMQQQPNRTGLPDGLKAGVERLSGYSLDQVRVHYNSPKPAQLQALAYTQGTEVHVAPGQEKYLPHEAWHVVQQMQGRVKATSQVQGRQINHDSGLEKEADLMGNSAAVHRNQLEERALGNQPVGQAVVQTAKGEETDKEKFDRKMKELNDLIDETNEKLQKVHKLKNQFGKDSSMTPMNPAVLLQGLPTTDSLGMSKDAARLANFSSMVKEFVNSKQKANVTHAVWTGK